MEPSTKTFVIIGLAAFILGIFLSAPSKQYGAAVMGLSARLATSSNVTVSTSVGGNIFATSSCAVRIISTGNSGIMLTFSDITGESPSASVGHWQGPSTTVAYDGGQYGCGAVKAYSGVSQTLKVSETR